MKKLNDCPCKGGSLDKIIQPAILTALVKEELHGYKIIQRVAESAMFSGSKPDPTGVYRYLKIMENTGLIESRWDTADPGSAKRIYKVTASGYECLHSWIQTLEDYKNAIGRFLNEAKSVVGNINLSEQENGGFIMQKSKVFIIGGFLGAGKTTSILSIAKLLKKRNKSIAVITNDQGSQLVDTNFLSKEGISVMEVTGGCFCCNYDDFSQKICQIIEEKSPDVILSEPVGSCTDLIATIYRPMTSYLSDRFTLAPLSVVVDPKKVVQFLGNEGQSLYPDEIKYLFYKQIEEADIIVLNKTDLLSQKELIEVQDIIKKGFPDKELVSISAKENLNIDFWLEKIEGMRHKDDFAMDVDYQVYGKAESYLGWLNTSANLVSEEKFDVGGFVKEFMELLKNSLKTENLEIAHLKIFGISNHGWFKASLTGLCDDVDFIGEVTKSDYAAEIIINARINTEPEKLEAYVIDALDNISEEKNILIEDVKTECFMPGQPNPKYRMSI